MPDDLRSVDTLLTDNDRDTLRCIIERYLKAGQDNDPTVPTLEQWQTMRAEAKRLHEALRLGPPDDRTKMLERL